MELTKPSYFPPEEYICYLFTASLPSCQFALKLGIWQNLQNQQI